MKIFNQGTRLFTHHELQIPAGKFTDVPTQHREGVAKLLTAYPKELISAETADARVDAQGKELAALRAQNAELTQQVETLKASASAGDNAAEIVALREEAQRANEFANGADQRIRAASDRIAELERIANERADENDRLKAELDAATKKPSGKR